MDKLEQLYNLDPFGWKRDEKTSFYVPFFHELMRHHYQNCSPYKKLIDGLGYDIEKGIRSVADLPFLPVRLFKELELSSVKSGDVIKSMTSSGTSGQRVSKIFLDKWTAAAQQKVLTKITSRFLGPKRLPMLVVDSESTVSNRLNFSARSAGILGFSILGRDITYALDENLNIDLPVIQSFIKKHEGQEVLLFGFTSIIWNHFFQQLKKLNEPLDLSMGVLIHGGGWKKLIDQAVSNEHFKSSLESLFGLKRVYNYYGMVEQTGSIFMEGECGHLHCSIYSDIIFRRSDFTICDINERGLIELISLLPYSYPGHVILTEDVGELLGEDNCSCGLKGKYFKVFGRLKNAEIRGCSDTYKS